MRLAIAVPAILTAALPGSAASGASPRDLAGVWWTTAYRPRLVPADGKPIPFSAEGRARYAATMAGLKSGALVDQTDYLCLPPGMPRAMTSAYPFQIMTTPGFAVFAYEANRAYRLVRFTDKHANPDTWDPSYMGESIASWRGDTLVVDSANFKADKIYLDATGIPASDRLHLIERLRLLNGGKELEEVVTIEDPGMFTRPWTVRMRYRRRDDIQLRTDWVCGEPHRDVSAIIGAVAK